MPIYFGNNKVAPSGVDKVYYGSNLVYDSTPTPTTCIVEIQRVAPTAAKPLSIRYQGVTYDNEGDIINVTPGDTVSIHGRSGKSNKVYIDGQEYATFTTASYSLTINASYYVYFYTEAVFSLTPAIYYFSTTPFPQLDTPELVSTYNNVATWTSISGASSYSLCYRLGSSYGWTINALSSTNTSVDLTTISGFTSGEDYQIAIKAIGVPGVSLDSEISNYRWWTAP